MCQPGWPSPFLLTLFHKSHFNLKQGSRLGAFWSEEPVSPPARMHPKHFQNVIYHILIGFFNIIWRTFVSASWGEMICWSRSFANKNIQPCLIVTKNLILISLWSPLPHLLSKEEEVTGRESVQICQITLVQVQLQIIFQVQKFSTSLKAVNRSSTLKWKHAGKVSTANPYIYRFIYIYIWNAHWRKSTLKWKHAGKVSTATPSRNVKIHLKCTVEKINLNPIWSYDLGGNN